MELEARAISRGLMKVGNVGKFPVRLAMIYSQSDFTNRGIDRKGEEEGDHRLP